MNRVCAVSGTGQDRDTPERVQRTRFALCHALGMPQPHKGDRVYTPARLHPELSALIRAQARERRVPVGDVVAEALAQHYGRADLAPELPRRPGQEELPVSA